MSAYANGGQIPSIPQMGSGEAGGQAGLAQLPMNVQSPTAPQQTQPQSMGQATAPQDPTRPMPLGTAPQDPTRPVQPTNPTMTSQDPLQSMLTNAISDPMGRVVTRAMGGGIHSLAKGGRTMPGGYLDGAGDGMSDSIPATIGNKQPARLADGEFVIPADVVSHLGNGSTKAGAKHLYSMMDKVRRARTGTARQGKKINPNKFIPA
jgi:hypothetical protein